jgi:acyl-CoA synthetase (AMP-forming)/AMP-acid ligase II
MVTPRGIGMTETFGPHSMFEPASRADVLANPVAGLGPAILGFERRIVNPETGVDVADGQEGELLVRGPGMMRNLYGRERAEVFDAEGWYHTGDICLIEDEIIHFVSRSSEMIKTSGSNVAPAEVEAVMWAMPEVEEPVVFGMAHPRRGEQVVAVVQRVAGAELEEESVRDAVREVLSNYKVPRFVLILDEAEMPRLHSGKPDKRALRKLVAERLPRED